MPVHTQSVALGQGPIQAPTLSATAQGGPPNALGQADIDRIMAMGLPFPRDVVERAVRSILDGADPAVEGLFNVRLRLL